MADNRENLNPIADGGPPGQTGSQEVPKRSIFATVKKHWRLLFTLFLLFLIAVMYQWKTISVNSVKEEMKAERIHLTAKVNQIVLDKNLELVRLSAIPLSWAVRSEMVKGNHENIDQYFKQLVRANRFRSITLSASDGKIIVATDKSLEGKMVANVYSPTVRDQFETTVKVLPNGEIMAVVPVLGVAGKLGVMVLVYAPETINLETPGQM